MFRKEELQTIMERLNADAETKLTPVELERLLEEELSRPEEEMDADLIREIVLLLEDDAPGQAQELAWKKTVRRLRVKLLHPVIRWSARIAATLVILMGLLVTTYKTAEAFNCQLILRWMQPIAETFTLYTGNRPESTTTAPDGMYGTTAKVAESFQYAAIEESPEFLQGFPARPEGMPERLTYLQGSVYTDDMFTELTHVYQGDTGLCVFTVTVMNDGGQSVVHQYERTLDEMRDVYISGCCVTYYFNSENVVLSACWTKDNACYSIFGELNEAEIAVVVEATMNN